MEPWKIEKKFYDFARTTKVSAYEGHSKIGSCIPLRTHEDKKYTERGKSL